LKGHERPSAITTIIRISGFLASLGAFWLVSRAISSGSCGFWGPAGSPKFFPTFDIIAILLLYCRWVPCVFFKFFRFTLVCAVCVRHDDSRRGVCVFDVAPCCGGDANELLVTLETCNVVANYFSQSSIDVPLSRVPVGCFFFFHLRCRAPIESFSWEVVTNSVFCLCAVCSEPLDPVSLSCGFWLSPLPRL